MPRRPKPPVSEEDAAMEILRARGYHVKKPKTEYVNQGLQINKQLYGDFQRISSGLGLFAYEALEDAMRDWIKKHS